MKGVFFQKPLEINLEVIGESWKQGDKIQGHLKITVHGEANLEGWGVFLCQGPQKKVKSKDIKAFSIIEEAFLQGEDLAFEFQLKKDCPITEKGSSLFMVCGKKEDLFAGGVLELQILPCDIITNYLKVLEDFFRFKVKTLKNKNKGIEAKLIAPATKEMSAIQDIKLNLKMVEKNLELFFSTKIKKMSYEGSTIGTKDDVKELAQSLTPKDYEIYGSTNQEGISKKIKEFVDFIKLRPIL